MIELHSHDAMYHATRDHCARHGWTVEASAQNRGEEAKGKLTISRNQPGYRPVVINCPYTLPRYCEVWVDHLTNLMTHEDNVERAKRNAA